MNFLTYLLSRLISQDRVERHFSYLILLLLINTLIYIFISPNITLFLTPLTSAGSAICNYHTLLIFSFIYIIYFSQLSENNKYLQFSGFNILAELTKTGLFLALMLSLLTFYKGSNHVQYLRFLEYSKTTGNSKEFVWDSILVNIDTQLLPFFPKGQISLYLDTDSSMGITSTIGKIYSEILQIFYISYYLWGNILGAYLTYYYYLNITQKFQKRIIYRLILMFLTCWIGGFIFNIMLNLIFPAVSPRIYLEYQNEIQGYYFCQIIRNNLHSVAENTFGAFPSAHCSLSWIVPILTYRMNMKLYTLISFSCAILISISTLVMRYHYFIDFIAGFVVVFTSCWFGGFLTHKGFIKSLELQNLDLEEFDFKILRSKENEYIFKN